MWKTSVKPNLVDIYLWSCLVVGRAGRDFKMLENICLKNFFLTYSKGFWKNMSLLGHYESDPIKRIFLLHCQKDDIMFLFQRNILAVAIKLPQEIYYLKEVEKTKFSTLCVR